MHERSAGTADRLTASTFHEVIDDPVEAERRRLRPIPIRPYRRTRTGNLFHEWVERRLSTARGTAVPLGGIDFDLADFGVGDNDAEGFDDVADIGLETAEAEEPSTQLQQLIDQFERSRWATLQPIAVEQEITIPFAGRTLVCKLDAIYRSGEGDDVRYEIVDWKSGRPPRNEDERSSRFLQLDLYRHAYARWAGIAPELIDVTLFYVAEGQEFKGEARRSFDELERLWLESASASYETAPGPRSSP